MARVLVVDDAAFMRKVVSDALVSGGHGRVERLLRLYGVELVRIDLRGIGFSVRLRQRREVRLDVRRRFGVDSLIERLHHDVRQGRRHLCFRGAVGLVG